MSTRVSGQKPRQVWTPEEDRILSNAVAKETPQHGSISWHKVAAHLPNRNNKDCRKRWHYSIAHTIRKGTWTKEEDEKLLAAVEKYGARWSKVAVVVGSRNGDQCWKRWYDCLDPRIDKSPWTVDEDAKLLHEVALHGRNWSEIVNKHFPNRTSLAAKNRYSILQRRRDTAVESVATSRSEMTTISPRVGVPLLIVEEAEETPVPNSKAAAAADMGLTGFTMLTEGNMNEFLQQSLTPSDGWYTDGTLSEVSTPRLPSEMDWASGWSPSPSPLDASLGCSQQGLMGGYGTEASFTASSPADMFPVANYNMDDFYLMKDPPAEPPLPPNFSTNFLYPEYGNW